MELALEDITRLTEDIWLSTVGLAVRPSEETVPGRLSGRTLDGIVNITGDYHGAVVVQCPLGLAARLARAMFDLGSGRPTLADMQDALGEITNMTGGNVKALLPGTCHLSLPAVVEGEDYTIRVPGTRTTHRAVFACGSESFVVSIVSAGERDA
jgi:CheY-specific phosphatase CheX